MTTANQTVATTPVRLHEPFLGRDRKPYRPDPDLVTAANVALLLEAPLLLTGEPGCGKTHFAWAAASALQRAEREAGRDAPPEPLACYVRSDTRARDLLYHYDALRRYGDAQLGPDRDRRQATDARPYIELQPLGRALLSSQRCVVLIDEIDKAPRDLPNDLLRELDQGQFEIHEIAKDSPPDPQVYSHGIRLQRAMRAPEGARKPLVIITSNIERQLPDAFLRRCVFYHIRFPGESILLEILQFHFGTDSSPPAPGELLRETPLSSNVHRELLRDVVTVFCALREFPQRLTKKPATAELLNWVRALVTFREEWDIVEQLATLANGIRSSRPIEWQRLPAACCLLKLREDLDRVLAIRAA